MRRLFAVLFVGASAAWAQKPPPPLEPLPEPPPIAEGADEPRVRIPVQPGDQIEPLRRNGQVIAVMVTPPGGRPYYLIDTSGNGSWMRRDSLDTGLAVPMFPLFVFD